MLPPCAWREACCASIAPRLYRRPLCSASSSESAIGWAEGAPELTLLWNEGGVWATAGRVRGSMHKSTEKQRNHGYRMGTTRFFRTCLERLPSSIAVIHFGFSQPVLTSTGPQA